MNKKIRTLLNKEKYKITKRNKKLIDKEIKFYSLFYNEGHVLSHNGNEWEMLFTERKKDYVRVKKIYENLPYLKKQAWLGELFTNNNEDDYDNKHNNPDINICYSSFGIPLKKDTEVIKGLFEIVKTSSLLINDIKKLRTDENYSIRNNRKIPQNKEYQRTWGQEILENIISEENQIQGYILGDGSYYKGYDFGTGFIVVESSHTEKATHVLKKENFNELRNSTLSELREMDESEGYYGRIFHGKESDEIVDLNDANSSNNDNEDTISIPKPNKGIIEKDYKNNMKKEFKDSELLQNQKVWLSKVLEKANVKTILNMNSQGLISKFDLSDYFG